MVFRHNTTGERRSRRFLAASSVATAALLGAFVSAAQADSAVSRRSPVPRTTVCIDAQGAVSRVVDATTCAGTTVTWSARQPAPQLCWDNSSLIPTSRTRTVSVRPVVGCGLQQETMPVGAVQLCADSSTGVLRWPVTGSCAMGNVATKVIVGSSIFNRSAGAAPAGTTAPSTTPVAPRVGSVLATDRDVRFTLSGMVPDTGNYAVQWVEQGQSFARYQMIRSTSKDVAISVDNFRCDRTYSFRVFAMRQDWMIDQGHSNQNVTPHSALVDVAMTHPCIGNGATSTTAPTCATGGTCAVGDTGPGGGVVFYVHSGGGTFACGRALQSTCKYLEAAPTSGTSAWTLTSYAWSGNTTSAIGSTARLTAVGEGFSNTLAIVRQSGGGSTSSRAATSSRAYRGSASLFDWYLPSRGELQQMFLQKTTLGISTGNYWSSTEDVSTAAYYGDFSGGTWYSAGSGKSSATLVRPIRAFGGTLGCADGGTCAVGDIGPGGGPVFYVAPTAFTSTGSDCGTNCLYLEASLTADETFSRNWATGANQSLLVSGADGTTIGSGYQNTLDIVAQTGNIAASSAAAYAYDYSSDFKTDWHLPSRAELNEMCKYAVSITPGNLSVRCVGGALRSGFASSVFMSTWWNSTEISAVNAQAQFFTDGTQNTVGKNASYAARPVRAF